MAVLLCSGQAAALAGGTTLHFDMLMPNKGGDILGGFARHTEAAKRSVMDYSFHIVITHWNDQVGRLQCVLSGANAASVIAADKGSISATFAKTRACVALNIPY